MSREPLWRRYARFFRPDPRADIDEEMQFHIDERARELVTAGLDPRAAAAKAREEFGNAAAARVACEAIRTIETTRVTRVRAWTDIGQDIRYALRSVARRPAHAVLVTITLALGLGATTAILSVVNGVLLRPLPYEAPERLAWVYEWSPGGDDHNPVSPGNYMDWKARTRSFVAMGAHYHPYDVTLTGSGEPDRLVVTDATPSLMTVLGVSPSLGRLFTASDASGDGQVLVISHALWKTRFGADPGILSQRLVLDGQPWTILGVMPEGFAYPDATVNIWRLQSESAFKPDDRRSHNLAVVGRIRDGATFAQAQTEMDAITTQLVTEYPQFMKDWRVNVTPMHADIVAPVRSLIVILLAGATLLLVVACGNAGNLLLTRAIARSREIAVRGALGAGGYRIIRQLLVECLVLAMLAALAGVAVAFVALRALLALAPEDLPRLEQIRLDPVVLGWTVIIAIVSTVLVGLAPALRLARVDLQSALRSSTTGDRHGRLRGGLVIMEVAASLVMLVGAGLLVRSFERLRRVDFGYEPGGLLAVSFNLPRTRYPDAPAQFDFYRRLQERLGSFPGVTAATGSSDSPGDTHPMTFSFAIQGKVSPNPSGRFDPVPMHAVMPGYFSTMGIPLLRGRAIDSRDVGDAPAVAMVNQALAKQLWSAEDPVGSHIAFAGPEGPWFEVVGIVGDTRMEAVDAEPRPTLYTPWLQKSWRWLSWQTALIRLPNGVDPSGTAASVRRLVTELDPDLAILHLATAEDLYAEGQARRRLAAVLLGGFAVTALVLGIIGLYGVMTTTVAERQREIGIRMALGAGRGGVLAMVLSQAGQLILGGIAVGTIVAAASTKLLTTMLYQTSPVDPLTFVAVAALLAVAGLGAALLPARRATTIDPMSAIRE